MEQSATNQKYVDNLQIDKRVPFQVLEDAVMSSAGLPTRKFLHQHERRYLVNGQYRKYWLASRTESPSQNPNTKKPDAVIICGIVNSPEGRFLVLTSELRIALASYELGFPAGLVDEGETAEQAAVREFREETGLVLNVTRVSPNLYSSAGMTDEAVPMVFGTAEGIVSDEYLEASENIIVTLASPAFVKRILDGQCEDVAFGAKAWCTMHGILNDNGTDFRV